VHLFTTIDQAVHGRTSETARQQSERHQTTDVRHYLLLQVTFTAAQKVSEVPVVGHRTHVRQAPSLQGGPRGV